MTYEITWVGMFRVFRMINKYIDQGGELNKFDLNTYKFLFDQLDSDKKNHILDKFGKNLYFLSE